MKNIIHATEHGPLLVWSRYTPGGIGGSGYENFDDSGNPRTSFCHNES